MKDLLWVLMALLVLGAGYLAQRSGWFEQSIATEVVEMNCDLQQGPCDFQLPGVVAGEFQITPRPFSALQPMALKLQLVSPEVTLTSVKMRFEGLNMDMGFNQVQLDIMAPGRYSGKALLPACTASQMQWAFHLLLEAGGRNFDFRFPVTTS